jgi:hypothetical protein
MNVEIHASYDLHKFHAYNESAKIVSEVNSTTLENMTAKSVNVGLYTEFPACSISFFIERLYKAGYTITIK